MLATSLESIVHSLSTLDMVQEIPEAILNMEVEGDIDMEAEAPEALQPKAGAGELVPRQEAPKCNFLPQNITKL